MLSEATYYVSMTGTDSGKGTQVDPFKTIQKAADAMYPGDTCIISEGVYREWVKPPRGGSSETRRITYRAAKGESVVVKGSERIRTWSEYADCVWKVELPDTFFGEFNPFRTNISGRWLAFGREYHLGEVYINGISYCEKMSLAEVMLTPGTWYTTGDERSTIIYANFESLQPNTELTEINVRECIFFPLIKGLGYITVDGLSMVHAAANWVNFTDFQHAAVGTYYGRSWIIQNCHIADAKCAGLVCGNDPSD